MTMHILCGIPGSGKTTLSKQLKLEYNAILYCYDKFPRAHWDKESREKMHVLMANDMRCGKSVVCDDLNITKSDRISIIKALRGINCQKILHVMTTPPDLCVERIREREQWKVPACVVLHCLNYYEVPSLDEGWDEIVYH